MKLNVITKKKYKKLLSVWYKKGDQYDSADAIGTDLVATADWKGIEINVIIQEVDSTPLGHALIFHYYWEQDDGCAISDLVVLPTKYKKFKKLCKLVISADMDDLKEHWN